MMPVRLEPAASRSQVKHSTTEPLRSLIQGLYRLVKYWNMEGFLEKSLKIKSSLKITGKSLLGLEFFLILAIFCRNGAHWLSW